MAKRSRLVTKSPLPTYRKQCDRSPLYFLSFSKNRVKQVVNYVNYLAKIGGATSTPPVSEVPKEAKVSSWLDDFDDPSSRSTGPKRTEWDREDTKLLKEAFRDFSKLPATTDIRKTINNNRRLKDLMEQEG